MNVDPLTQISLQAAEHEAWVEAAQELRRIGLDLNSVDSVTFEPARLLLNRWAIAYARGHALGIFTTPEEPGDE